MIKNGCLKINWLNTEKKINQQIIYIGNKTICTKVTESAPYWTVNNKQTDIYCSHFMNDRCSIDIHDRYLIFFDTIH